MTTLIFIFLVDFLKRRIGHFKLQFLLYCIQKGPMLKLIHLKSQTSVALPIYTSDLSNLSVIEKREKNPQTPKKKVTTS